VERNERIQRALKRFAEEVAKRWPNGEGEHIAKQQSETVELYLEVIAQDADDFLAIMNGHWPDHAEGLNSAFHAAVHEMFPQEIPEELAREVKECVSCKETIPKSSRFCFYCGEKQAP